MSSEGSKGKVIIEEDDNDDDDMGNKCDDIESKIVVEEGYYEDEATSDISMEEVKQSAINSQALDLSFIPCSVPPKKRKINTLGFNKQSCAQVSEERRNTFRSLKDNQLNYGNFESPYCLPFKPSLIQVTSSSSMSLSLVDQGLNKSTINLPTNGSTKGMSCRRPGFITCSICNATKYYSHVQRRFGQYSCEPCSKFMKRFLRDPKIFTCSHKGHCTIGKPYGEQEPRGVSVNRCKACWLKICLEKFILDSGTRLVIDKYYAPKFDDTSTAESTRSSDLVETNEVSYPTSPPPLPFPQRKRKPKTETVTNSPSSESCREPLCLTIGKKDQNKLEPMIAPSVLQNKSKDDEANRDSIAISRQKASFSANKSQDSITREDDLNDLSSGDYTIKDEKECGKCNYCAPSIDEKANVVVVQENCKHVHCRLNGLSSKKKDISNLNNDDTGEDMELECKTDKGDLRNEVKNGTQKEESKKVMLNKPLKKMLITEHFINNIASSRREVTGPLISSESNFLTEILNANSPFL